MGCRRRGGREWTVRGGDAQGLIGSQRLSTPLTHHVLAEPSEERERQEEGCGGGQRMLP